MADVISELSNRQLKVLATDLLTQDSGLEPGSRVLSYYVANQAEVQQQTEQEAFNVIRQRILRECTTRFINKR